MFGVYCASGPQVRVAIELWDVPPYAYARDHPNTTGCPTRRHETESVAHEYIFFKHKTGYELEECG